MPEPTVISNTTISGNSAGMKGGGVYVYRHPGPVTLTNVTVTDNTGDGGGIYTRFADKVTLHNSIVTDNFDSNSTPDDIWGGFVSSSSLIGTGDGATRLVDAVNGNQVGTAGAQIDPRLEPLRNDGGRTPTHALLSDSPAINKLGHGSLPVGAAAGNMRGRILRLTWPTTPRGLRP